MMSWLNLFVLTACLGVSHGAMQCSWGERNVVEQLFDSCPPAFGPSENEYCCIDTHGQPKCCNLLEFALTYIIIAVVVVAILSVVCCLISCFCCPCCFVYKRRHGNPI